MLFKNVSLLSIEYLDATEIVTSESIEKQLEPVLQKFNMRSNIINALTGIRERRFWEKGVQPSEPATKVGIKAIESAGIPKDKIDILINASLSKDYIEPAVASLVHGNLNLKPECINFDISNACLGFINSIQVVSNMIENGVISYGLIVGCEDARYTIENTIEKLLKENPTEEKLRNDFATFTIGSGAVAMVLGKRELHPDTPQIVSSLTMCDTYDGHNQLCIGNYDGMKTDSKNLLNFGIDLIKKTYNTAKSELDWAKKQIDHIIPHQVGAPAHIRYPETFEMAVDRIHKTFDQYGNTGPLSIPLTLCKALEKGLIKTGERLILGGVGSGLNCTLMEVVW